MKQVFYQWISPHIRPPRWMCYAHYSAQRNKLLFVVPPINLLVLLAWWVQDRWAKAANADSWIELEVMERIRNRYRR